jgi:hypothetical protein
MSDPVLYTSEILAVIAKDIQWHRKNRGSSGCSPSFERGMITGSPDP